MVVKILRRVGEATALVLLMTSALVTVVLMFVGFLELFSGLIHFFYDEGGDKHAILLVKIFSALDLMVVAPMSFVIITAILDYAAAARGEADTSVAKINFTRAKSLIFGLLAAAVSVRSSRDSADGERSVHDHCCNLL